MLTGQRQVRSFMIPGNNGLKARKSTGLAARSGEGVSLLPLLRFLQEMKLN
jgi:hypothetical protein